MRNIFCKSLCALLLTTLFVACKKDDSCTITLPIAGAFVHNWGESASVLFETSNVSTVTVSATNGWKGSASLATHTVTVTAPESADAENAERSAVVTLTATSPGGETSTATLNAYIIDNTVDLSADGTSNCYVITEPDKKYKFNTNFKAETNDRLATASAGIVWESSSSLVRYLTLDKDGYAEFYVAEDSDSLLREGNAVVAAYNDAGDIIWSWHLWLTNSDPATEDIATYSNGTTIMGRNLGSFGNSNGSTETSQILASYGLYYQWGRKDPFPRPRYYNCANSIDESLYDGDGSYVYITVEESDAQKGTVAYATAHPETMIVAPGSSSGDWLYSGRDNSLWGDNGNKTMYDPCPRGWRVASKNDLAVLTLTGADDEVAVEAAKPAFGWALTDSGSGEKYFYLGGGYRNYFDGILSNIDFKDEYPYTPIPWIGCYWTNTTSGSNGCAMIFDLNNMTTRSSITAPDSERYRANAMQIRCVKE